MRWLLLHGTPLSPEVWDGVAAKLCQYGDVHCPDITPDPDDHDPQATLAGRLVAELAREPGPVHVVGHSFGGQVALDLALASPPWLGRLTILCSRHTPYPPFAAAADALRHGEPGDVGGMLDRWFTPPELAADGPVVGYARRRLAHADRGSWAAALDGIARYDRSQRVASITVPVALMAAEHDQVPTPVVMSDLCARLPRATLHVLRGAKHMTPFADPAALAQRIARGD